MIAEDVLLDGHGGVETEVFIAVHENDNQIKFF